MNRRSFDETSQRVGWIGFQAVAVLAFVLLALVVIRPIDIAMVVAATALLVGSRFVGSWSGDGPTRAQIAGLAATAFLVVLGLAAWQSGPAVGVTAVVILPVAIAVGLVSVLGHGEERGVRALATGLLVLAVFGVGGLWIVGFAQPEIDVLDLHVAAAEILADGGNPYAEARAIDTSPDAAPGSEIVGYPYTPLTMLAYAGSAILLGDPRWASVIAIAAAIILLVRPWAPMVRAHAAALLAIGLALVVQPSLGHIFSKAWTEPIAVPLLVSVGLLWRRNPALAAVLLGLTLGLKQYWIVALPLLLIWNDDFRWKRVGIAGSVAALSLLPAFFADPSAAWNAMVVALMEVRPRLDSIGFAGIGWNAPFWLVLAISAVVALWMGWRGGSAARFHLALAATLATAFLFGSQAFVNYWFLIATMAMIAVASDVSTGNSEVGSGVDEHPVSVSSG